MTFFFLEEEEDGDVVSVLLFSESLQIAHTHRKMILKHPILWKNSFYTYMWGRFVSTNPENMKQEHSLRPQGTVLT